jgi:hypothetical protein
MLKRLAFAIFVFSTQIASAAPTSVCNRGMAEFQQFSHDEASRIAGYNHGGMFNGGVCWWHSRLQRAAIYLAEFRPELPKPNSYEAQGIINRLSSMSQVVVIPGYSSFQDFTRDFPYAVQHRLESWQREDGILRFRWISGLRGATALTDASMRGVMEAIHNMVAVQHRIVFEKLSMPGITSHAWLIIGSRKTSDGYVIEVIDSNSPGSTTEIEYRYGDNYLHYPYSTQPIVPYLQYDGDLNRIFWALQNYCKR